MKIPLEKFASFSENFETLFKSKFDVFAQAFHSYQHAPYDEVIHDIRVYSRRLVEPANILGSLSPDADISSFISRNKKIRSALSGYRDLEVTRAYLVNETMSSDEEELKYHFRILNQIEDMLDAKKTDIDMTISSFNIDEASRDVHDLCQMMKDIQMNSSDQFVKSTRSSIRKMIRKREKSVERYLDKSKKSKCPDDLHQLRIEIKKARYVLEFIHELDLADLAKHIKRYTKIQQLLGTYCDMLLLVKYMKDIAGIQSEFSDHKYFTDYCRKLSCRFNRKRNKLMKKALGFNYDKLYIIL
jgi:CHAD domain-containing protein